MRCALLATLALSAAGCTGDAATDGTKETELPDTGVDVDPPQFQHNAIPSPQYVDEDVYVDARVWDEDSQILAVQVFYRRQTASDWESGGMLLTEAEDVYGGNIQAEKMGSAGMHYYFKAVDTESNEGVYPEGAPADYLKFDLTE